MQVVMVFSTPSPLSQEAAQEFWRQVGNFGSVGPSRYRVEIEADGTELGVLDVASAVDGWLRAILDRVGFSRYVLEELNVAR